MVLSYELVHNDDLIVRVVDETRTNLMRMEPWIRPKMDVLTMTTLDGYYV
jgi:hypothetical protein